MWIIVTHFDYLQIMITYILIHPGLMELIAGSLFSKDLHERSIQHIIIIYLLINILLLLIKYNVFRGK